ncbi:bacillithiol biosynthesis cysteine-adding enzyme BshC [Danxiaibacter flavus]|uniref:Putative cysteine ligase BshC n=1 Tax=Danxiaibacter flavus TaxID=3049108 RepID=A0ABV3ZJ85_9BACT|nr:bacillithiol biosynthesis cysteine-adding enzyme BshC [Chitinophagaceae bacterium DXS]
METNCTYTSYEQTGFFSRIVTDYLAGHQQLKPFYQYTPDIDGIKAALADRQHVNYNRPALVNALRTQYEHLTHHHKVAANLDLLLQPHTFVITTAHQPNIFTGPLYFIYKILHAIQLADKLSQQLPDYNFVPVYYMGSEDADLDELGQTYINDKPYVWQTKQTGAVGRMKVDKAFLSLIDGIESQIAVLPYGKELTEIFRQAYKQGSTIQEATLAVTNALFGKYGLIVVIPDNPALKALYKPVIQKELQEQFSYKIVSDTAEQLDQHYKVQAGGRELNLFYLIDDKRERIEKINDTYVVNNLGLHFTAETILKELDEHPERFSPNVILRGALQETILPGVAFIGGGGELAYWLELKNVFAAVNVPYPVLVLRNSFLVVEEEWAEKTKQLQLKLDDLFKPEHDLMNMVVALHSANTVRLNGELDKIDELYKTITERAALVDSTLHDHVMALKTRALQRLEELEKKMIRAEKRKFSMELERIRKIKAVLFPSDSLQERRENIAGLYGLYGAELLDVLLQNSLTLEQQFGILEIK